MKGDFLQADSKLELPEMNTYLYITLHNEIKSYLSRKLSRLITLCIWKKEGRYKRK